jgi:DNA-binding response OmpR family regulator
VRAVTTILVAADARWVRDQVRAAFVAPGQRVVEVTRGQDVRDAFAAEDPDLVILDLQIGNMGGVATAIDLRLEESADRLERATILLLLDREADRFIAKRADADGVLVKPVDAGTLRRAAKRLLADAAARRERVDDVDDVDNVDEADEFEPVDEADDELEALDADDAGTREAG